MVTFELILNVKGLLIVILRGGSGCVLCDVFDLYNAGAGC